MKSIKNKLFIFSFLLLAFLSCKSTSVTSSQDFNNLLEVQNESIKIDSFIKKEINTTVTIIKIDLQSPNISINIAPNINDNNYSNKQKLFSLSDFSKSTNSLIAINTTPFIKTKENKTTVYIPLGITKTQNKIISEPQEKYSALVFYYINQKLFAKIVQNQYDLMNEKYPYAIGGYFTILQNGSSLYKTNSFTRRSRTACGISKDGRYLFLLSAVPNNSLTDNNGLTFNECALILNEYGANDAILFDGGHSTAMIINQKNTKKPLFQRKIASALGFSF